MRLRLFLSLLLGVAVLVAVLMRFDLGLVAQSLKHVGLRGFVVIVAAGLVAEVVLASGIVPLLPHPMPLAAVVAARQLRDSSGDVLPITQFGGIVLAARTLVLAGMAAPKASAAVVADVTTELFAQGLYVLVGVLASLSLLAKSPTLSPYVGAMLGGAIFLSLGSIAFALVQLHGGKRVDRLGKRLFAAKLVQVYPFHETIDAIYRRRGRVAQSVLLQFAGWIASGLWLWVMLDMLGLGSHLLAAIAIQAMVEGLRSATVFIPAGLGIQEAGYAALAPVFGFSPEIGLALSLLRRARDLVVAVPVLLVWQLVEGGRAWQS